MSNALTPFSGAKLPATTTVVQGLTNLAREKPSVGGMPLLRLVDGEWVFGPDNTAVETDSEWAIHPGGFSHGYVCWDDGVLVGEVMRPAHEPRPTQAELPPVPAQWQEQLSIVLACVSGADKGTTCLYKNSSLGGREAISLLGEAIVTQAQKDPEAIVPIVALASTDYRHKKFGKVYKPVFEVLEFVRFSDVGAERDEGEDEGEDAPEPTPEPVKPVRQAPKPAAAPARTRRQIRG